MNSITPFIVTKNNGEEMINYYISIFKDSEILSIQYYKDLPQGNDGDLLNGHVKILNQEYFFMDLKDEFNPNAEHAEKFLIQVESEEDFNNYYDSLKEGGSVLMEPSSLIHFERCTWIKDKFGINWQIVLLKIKSLTLKNIKNAHSTIAETRGFKAYFNALKEMNLSFYIYEIENNCTTYMTNFGDEIEDDTLLEELRVINPETDKVEFEKMLREHQQGLSDFDYFAEHCAKYGVSYWKVDFINNLCCYYDLHDNIVFEENIN